MQCDGLNIVLTWASLQKSGKIFKTNAPKNKHYNFRNPLAIPHPQKQALKSNTKHNNYTTDIQRSHIFPSYQGVFCSSPPSSRWCRSAESGTSTNRSPPVSKRLQPEVPSKENQQTPFVVQRKPSNNSHSQKELKGNCYDQIHLHMHRVYN